MALASTKTPQPKKNAGIPLWFQAAIGVTLVIFIYLIATSGPLYKSDWTQENSSFYENATQALKMFSINPSAPTLVLFWERSCEICKSSMKTLRSVHPSLRIYGVHVPIGAEDRAETSKTWARFAPKRSALIYDRNEMLKSTFSVKGVPKATLILPKQKKMYTYLGDIRDNKKELVKLIKTEL